jgi:membrane protein
LNILKRLLTKIRRGKLSLMAAAIAFYGIFSLVPIITAFVSLYGLAFDSAAVEVQVGALSGVMPKEALDLVSAELTAIVSSGQTQLGIGLVVSVAIALGVANEGTSALMTALNVAYGAEETRGFVAYYACSLLLTAGLLAFGIFSLALLAALPAFMTMLPFGALGRALVAWLRWPVMAVLTSVAITAIYRYGPDRSAARRRWMSWGTVAATLLWIAGSALFSVYLQIGVYIGKLPSSEKTYGALGAVVVLLTWLWLSAFAVLLGGALDAALELKVSHDASPAGREP